MKTFFTSDLHIGHQNILTYCSRPFKDINHMTEGLIVNWNSVVAPEDTIYILGDACMGQRDKTVPLMQRFNGTKFLILGNHDNAHNMYKDKKSYEASLELYESVFTIIGEQMTLETGDGPVLLCHFPYHDPKALDYQGRDFSPWEPDDDGMTLFCGHVHSSWHTKLTPKNTPMINVGVDVNDYSPTLLEDLLLLAQTLKEKTK